MTCRFCDTGFDSELAALFESEDRFEPIAHPEFTDRQLLTPDATDTRSHHMSALSLILMVLLILGALGSVALGASMLTRATMAVGLICVACFLGIVALLIQGAEHHRRLTRSLSPRQ